MSLSPPPTQVHPGPRGRLLTLLKWGLIIIASLTLAAVVLVGGYYAYQRWVVADMMRIDEAVGIHTIEAPLVNGTPQWIQIRGQDRLNPVLLFIHGGPGMTMMPLAHLYQPSWEKHFTVAQWDQRGAGKSADASLPESPATPMLDTYIADALDVARYVAAKTGKRRIGIVGHNWGSIIGLELVRRRPDLFYAYVGTGQFYDGRAQEAGSYAFSVRKARETGNSEALRELAAISPYPEILSKSQAPAEQKQAFLTNLKWMMAFQGDYAGGQPHDKLRRAITLSPAYNLLDIYHTFYPKRSMFFYGRSLEERLNYKMKDRGSKFDVPLYFFLGRKDFEAPAAGIVDEVRSLEAPHAEVLWFERSAHFPMMEEPDRFKDLLVSKIRPLGDVP